MIFGRKADPETIKNMVASAVADATNAVTLASHMAQCEKDKAETKAEQLRMHNENRIEREKDRTDIESKFSKIERQNTSIMRVVYIATGVLAACQFFLSQAGGHILSKLVP
jgi:hypothetical protein